MRIVKAEIRSTRSLPTKHVAHEPVDSSTLITFITLALYATLEVLKTFWSCFCTVALKTIRALLGPLRIKTQNVSNILRDV